MPRLVWKLLDPLILRFRARYRHLDSIARDREHEAAIRASARFSEKAIIDGACIVGNSGLPENVTVGDFSLIRGELLTLTPSARIAIGHHTHVGVGTRIWAADSITIGDFVQIAASVDILDGNSHPLDYRMRREEAISRFENKEPYKLEGVPAAPVTIEDDVWIGVKSTVLKGVHIGRGSIVAASSVVVHDVPPFTLVAGNPARAIKSLA
jgi:acetyltransferase-like isoleucine patch superfamily enzyme